jgi:hypothetical protein
VSNVSEARLASLDFTFHRYEHASKEELETLKNKHITQHQEDESANPKLNEENVHVYYEDQLWNNSSFEACSYHFSA